SNQRPRAAVTSSQHRPAVNWHESDAIEMARARLRVDRCVHVSARQLEQGLGRGVWCAVAQWACVFAGGWPLQALRLSIDSARPGRHGNALEARRWPTSNT